MNKYRLMANAALGLAVWACGMRTLSAQQAATADGIPVHMVVTVEPHRGSTIPVVNREDVMVYEGKDRDPVKEWIPAQGNQAGLEFFILLDDGSDTGLGTQLDDLRKFISAEPASTEIGIAYMRNGMATVVQNLTNDHEQAAKALRLPLGAHGANGSPYFSLSDLIKHWPEGSGRREVFMATNGIDPYYDGGDLMDPYVNEAIGSAQRAGVIVSAIYTPGAGHAGHDYWQAYWGQLYLAQVADRTGGESYYIGFTGPPVSFAPYLDDVTQRLSHQYLLTFLAKPPKKAGFQQIKLRTEVPNADLVSADRVWVPVEPK